MSVYQVEEYYIHMSIASASKKAIEKIKEYLSDEGISDFELQGEHIVIDGFESESDAERCEEAIDNIVEVN